MHQLLKRLCISGCVKLKTAFLIYKPPCINLFHHTNPITFSSTYAFCKLDTTPWPFILFSFLFLGGREGGGGNSLLKKLSHWLPTFGKPSSTNNSKPLEPRLLNYPHTLCISQTVVLNLTLIKCKHKCIEEENMYNHLKNHASLQLI